MKFRDISSILLAGLLSSIAMVVGAEELRVMCYEGYVTQAMADDFSRQMKTKGVEVTISVRNAMEPQEMFDALRGKAVDIVTPSHNVPRSPKWKLIEAKLTLPLNLDHIPNYKTLLPSLQKADYLSAGGKVYGVPYTYGPYGLAYNTALVKEEPKSWAVLFDPKYAGKYALSSNYHEANVYIAALASGVARDKIGDMDELNAKPEVQEKLNLMARNAKNLWKGVDTAKDLKGLALATSWGFALPELKKQGEVWKMATPREGVTGWVDNFMLAAELESNPRKLKLAEEFLNYLISPEVQARNVVRTLGSYPVNTAVKPLLTAEEVKTFRIDDPDFFRNELILWKVLSPRNQNGLRQMWLKAKGGK